MNTYMPLNRWSNQLQALQQTLTKIGARVNEFVYWSRLRLPRGEATARD